MTKMTGGQAVVQALQAENVSHVFGLIGSAGMEIFDALFDAPSIKFIGVRDERTGVHMADGYARATGKAGVVLVTSGPGATNAVTGIATAYMDSIPMVVFTGQVPTHLIGNDAFQEVDCIGITRPCVKHNFLVKDVRELAETLKKAFHIARSGRPGPVVVDLPKDIQNWRGTFKGEGKLAIPGYRTRLERLSGLRPSEGACTEFFAQLGQAERPLLYVGGGVVNGSAAGELRRFAEAFGIPVVTDGGHIRKLEEVEADMIRLALARYQGQMSEVARKLGIGRSTLYRRMKDLGLDEAATG